MDSIFLGHRRSRAIRTDRTVRCWGSILDATSSPGTAVPVRDDRR